MWFWAVLLMLILSGAKARASERISAEPRENDQAGDFSGQLKYQSLKSMDEAKLRSVQLAESPWSDSYWPIYAGVLANRYADAGFPQSSNWKTNADFITSHLGSAASLDTLSPAEKYDLLVGDSGFTLTKNMLETGREYFEMFGKVETWMGICHGWAPASFMVPRPTGTVTALAADGKTQLTFFPADIKALFSLLWASAYYPHRSLGGRCYDKDVKFDEHGRIREPDCFDNNPATWHLVVVNRIGYEKQSFIIDANYGYEVWNQPVYGYSYTLFNPQTGKPAGTLEEATVTRSSFDSDPFKSTRGPKAVALVGVEMEVRYVSETTPERKLTDSPDEDSIANVHYAYDLELDVNGNIVGGEWHEQQHPDFLWAPASGARAWSAGDYQLDTTDLPNEQKTWEPGVPVPSSWLEPAKASSRHGQPLARIVEALGNRSRAPH